MLASECVGVWENINFPYKLKEKIKKKKEREKQVSGSSLGKVRANHINYLECISDPDDPPFTFCIYSVGSWTF